MRPSNAVLLKGVFLNGWLMNQSIVSEKSAGFLRLLLAVNFNAAVIFLLIVSVLSAMGSHMFFEDYGDLYGPMDNNLRLMLIYLSVSELAVYSFCRYSENFSVMVVMGLFLLLCSFGIEVYSEINEVVVDENYFWFFVYLGLSHLCYGLIPNSNKR